MSSLYLECNAGISGDMAVAALLDAGADKNVLQKALDSIPAKGFKTEISRVSKNGIDCSDFNVILDSEHENHDHDMEYLFGHESAGVTSLPLVRKRARGSTTAEQHHHEHKHHHENEHEHHHHEHEHRNLNDVLAIIDKTQMTDGARRLAHKIFQIIAEAESKAHGLPLEQVHFHEVGAIDSIVDVIALSVCFDNLSPSKVYVPALNEGTGTVRCQHGILPIPVPAVANIAQEYSLPLHLISDKGEFITPTGAAFAAAVMTDKILPESFEIKRIGLGAGKRAYSRPSILRAFIIEENESKVVVEQGLNHQKGNDYPNGHYFATLRAQAGENLSADRQELNDHEFCASDKIVKLETNIDDCSGQALGFVMDELLAAGARDVHYIPCFMKKNRPAYLLNVICTESDREKLESIIFKHTTTIGIRRSVMERTVLGRRELELDSPYGKFRAKVVEGSGIRRAAPEYDDIVRIAREAGKPFGEVYSELSDLCRKY